MSRFQSKSEMRFTTRPNAVKKSYHEEPPYYSNRRIEIDDRVVLNLQPMMKSVERLRLPPLNQSITSRVSTNRSDLKLRDLEDEAKHHLNAFERKKRIENEIDYHPRVNGMHKYHDSYGDLNFTKRVLNWTPKFALGNYNSQSRRKDSYFNYSVYNNRRIYGKDREYERDQNIRRRFLDRSISPLLRNEIFPNDIAQEHKKVYFVYNGVGNQAHAVVVPHNNE